MLSVWVITASRAAFYHFPSLPERATSTYALEPNIHALPKLVEAGPPTPPLGLTATGELKRISLSWLPPTDNGGLPIVNYLIFRTMVSGNESYPPYATIGNETFYVDSNVTIGIRYYYEVQASNGAYSGSYSNEANAQPLTLPSAPRNLQVSALSGQIDLIWSPPLDNGGSAVTQYRIYRAAVFGTEYQSSPIIVGAQLSFADFSVVGGTTYYYEITALTSAGEGAFSNQAYTIVYSHTSPPVGLAAVAGDMKVALSWSAPTSDGGSPVAGYNIYRGTYSGGESFYEFTNQTTFTDYSVTAGATYFYLVKAINSAGESDYSFEVSVALPAPSPSIPWYLYMAASIAVVGVTGGVAIAVRPLPPPTSGEFTVGFMVELRVKRIRILSENWDRESVGSPKDS